MSHRMFGFGLAVTLLALQACGREGSNISVPKSTNQDQGSYVTQNEANPFVGADMYKDAKFAAQIESSVQKTPELARELGVIGQQSTAIWLDRIASLDTLEEKLLAARAQKDASGRPVVITFVVYNLPERDCAANASNGELNTGNGGVARYRGEYIDRIASAFAKFPDLRIVAMMEPDSLPNLATNMHMARCQVAAPIYREGVVYAIRALAMPHVSMYLDVAHGGWLGWDDNRAKVAQIFSEVLTTAGGSHLIRGFASNVANYSPLFRASPDPLPDSYYQWNPSRDEVTYVQKLAETFAAFGIQNRNFIIDTSRNGNPVARQTWGNWCNIARAGIGQRPKAAPMDGIDGYLWVKPPGESDGVSDPGAPRFDLSCQSQDSLLGAPQAGEWFHDHIISMAKNANPVL